ncbi:MAG TPA: AAA family ATPase [Candidatus Acidoferrales bacterium]|nr:AAA family ATPase [Candidatus Acidoferrales bacterium]
MKSFHSFRLDTVNHCLWRHDARLQLAPKAFDVLRYLVEHADRLVTQDEILEALWPETYVNAEVIKKYVLEIRKALGDQSRNPAFIATYPRRGYQFIAPIDEGHSPSCTRVNSSRAATIVGREAASRELQSALDSASQSGRQIVFVTGKAGIGKTTLVDFFLERPAFRGWIARGHCVEGFGGKEAYYPLFEAFGELLRDPEASPVLQAFAKRAPTWLVQFPALVDANQREVLEKQIAGATRERMVREICEALEAATSDHLLVLCLEDLHWVDPSTLDFLSALARRRGPAKLLVLGTYRPAEVIISQSPLRSLKQDLVVHGLGREISLERLEESDIASYIAAEFSANRLPGEFAGEIYRHSGGNALFMVSILRDLVKKSLLSRDAGEWSLTVPLEQVARSVPDTLDQLIELQFQQLSEIEQRVLRSASVAGERFSVWAIATAADLDSGGVEAVCEKLAERLQFIRFSGIHELPNGELTAHYDFLHSLYREVLYRRISEVSRSRLHLLLARRLQTFCDPCEQELATELALHFEGGLAFEQAVYYLILAAENAAARFSYRDSIEILNHALELVAKLPPEQRAAQEIRILECIGDAQFALGALPESAEAYEIAASRADSNGLKSAQVHALICGMYPLGFIDPDKGLAAMDKAVQTATAIGDPSGLARTQMLAASCRLVFDGWRRQDEELSLSAHRNLTENSTLDAYEQVVFGHFLTLCGRYHESLDIFETALARVDRSISLIPHFGALSGQTIALIRLGRFGELLRMTRAAAEFPHENRARFWLMSFREAWLRMQAFDFAGAYQVDLAVCDGTPEYHPAQHQTIGQIAAGYMARERGSYREALELFAPIHEAANPPKFFLHWMWRLTAKLESANTWLLAGNIGNARARAEDFLGSALATADPHIQTLAWDLQARVAVAQRNWTAARESVEQALALVGRFTIPVAAWQAHATAWKLYRRIGEEQLALASRERAENCVHFLASSFDPDEPLRQIFLSAAPVRDLLQRQAVSVPA